MDRVGEVNKISSFLTETQKQLDGILAKLKWGKEELLSESGAILVNCPENESHRVPKSSLDKHLAKCKLASQGVDTKDSLSSSQFFYESLVSVIPVMIDKAKYSSFKGVEERSSKTDAQSSAEHLTGNIQHPRSNTLDVDMNDVDHGDEDVTNTMEEFSSSLMLPQKDSVTAYQNPQEEIRSIYRWKLVPSNYQSLELKRLPPQTIKAWLAVNIPQTGLLSSMVGADVQLINFVMSCLNEQSIAYPDGLVTQLSDLLGQKTKPFVLKLWKFLAVSVVCHKYGVTEADRADAELLAAQDLKKLSRAGTHQLQPPRPVPPSESSTEPALPMDAVRFDLTPQQRLAVYEHVLQVGKERRNSLSAKFDESDSEAANETASATDSKRPKSKFEIMAEERDYKRRRQSYRAKNVHITKRSTVEVMRDLIETQMAVLEGQYQEQHGEVACSSSGNGDGRSREVPDERGDRETHRNHSRDWDRGKEREKERDWRERRGGRDRDRDGDRGRDRDRDRDRDRGRDRDRDKDRRRHRDKDRESESGRHRGKTSERHRERERHNYKEDRHRDRRRSKERVKNDQGDE